VVRQLLLYSKTYGLFNCTNQNSGTTVNKSGNTITLTFGDSTDYDYYKTKYQTLSGTTNMVNYTGNPANINYYKLYVLGVQQSNSCGDTVVKSNTYYTHASSPPLFDDANKTLTFIMVTMTNGFSSGSTCNDGYSVTNSMNSSIQGNINEAPYSYTTYVHYGSGSGGSAIDGYYFFQGSQSATQGTFWAQRQTSPPITACDLTSLGWYDVSTTTVVYTLGYRLTITDTSDPSNNFKVERVVDSAGVLITNSANYIKLYEIVGGVVIP
jgi:hypothetical protein